MYYQMIDKPKSITMSKEVQLEIQLVREMNHNNIAPLLGCSIDAPNIAIITELQQKGSIADILANKDIEVPWQFRFRLIRGICKGLMFLHRSEIRSHGRLTSRNCLVDNRWTIKLSGFGLHTFRSGRSGVGEFVPGMAHGVPNPDYEGADYASLFWTAPEILRTGVFHIDHVGAGTVNGDVYSLGLILRFGSLTFLTLVIGWASRTRFPRLFISPHKIVKCSNWYPKANLNLVGSCNYWYLVYVGFCDVFILMYAFLAKKHFSFLISEFCTREPPFSRVALSPAEIVSLIAGVKTAATLKVWNDHIAKNNVEEGAWVRPCVGDRQWPNKYEIREKLQQVCQTPLTLSFFYFLKK